MKNKLLILVLIFLCTGCKEQPKNLSIEINEFSTLDCFTPDDAIIKFHSLNENTFGNLVINFLKENGIEKDESNSLKINDWCKNRIFGLLNSKIEWQLYDKEFCKIESSTLLDGISDTELFESKILICNSFLNEDSSVGGNWWLYTEDYQINIMTCNQIVEQVGFVPYYEIYKKYNGDYELSLQRDMMKYYINSNILIEFKSKDESILVRDTLISDKGILYSGLIDSMKKEVDKTQKENKEEKIPAGS